VIVERISILNQQPSADSGLSADISEICGSIQKASLGIELAEVKSENFHV
jgi:hypothetical protein